MVTPYRKEIILTEGIPIDLYRNGKPVCRLTCTKPGIYSIDRLLFHNSSKAAYSRTYPTVRVHYHPDGLFRPAVIVQYDEWRVLVTDTQR